MERAFVEEKIRQLKRDKEKVTEFQKQLAQETRKENKKSASYKLLLENQGKAKKQLARIGKNISILEKILKKSKQ